MIFAMAQATELGAKLRAYESFLEKHASDLRATTPNANVRLAFHAGYDAAASKSLPTLRGCKMIEGVAKALEDHSRKGSLGDYWQGFAYAAIEAMKNPPDDVAEEACRFIGMSRENVKVVWNRLIVVALKGEQDERR